MMAMMLCALTTLLIILMAYCIMGMSTILKVIYWMMAIMYIITVTMTFVLFNLERKVVDIQNHYTQDPMPNAINDPIVNINYTGKVILAFQLIVGIIEHFRIYNYLVSESEISIPLIN